MNLFNSHIAGTIVFGDEIISTASHLDKDAPLTVYRYDSEEDILFTADDPLFEIEIYDGSDEAIAMRTQERGDLRIVYLRYKDTDREINFNRLAVSGDHIDIENNHIQPVRPLEIVNDAAIESGEFSFGTPEFRKWIFFYQIELKKLAQQRGQHKPTEGTMRQLIDIINQEVTKRVLPTEPQT